MSAAFEKCIIYGSGEWGRQAYWEYLDRFEILCYVDRNPQRWGTLVYGVEIKSPEELARHKEAVAIIAIDNDAGIEEYIRSFGTSQVVHYRYDAMTASKPALVYGTEKESLLAAGEIGERYRVSGLVGDRVVGGPVAGLKVVGLDFLKECPEAVLVVPENLAYDANLAKLHKIFSGDIMKYIPGEGIRPYGFKTWSQVGSELMQVLTPIPRKIHFCWLSGEAYPPLVQKCLDSWQEKLPDYELKIWTKENSPLNDNDYIREALSVGKYAFVSDYIRLYALYHEGGIYLDSDVEVLKDFGPLMMEPAFIGWERCGRVGPWLIASKAGNPIIKELLDEYEGKHFIMDGKMNLTVNTIPTTRLLIEKGLQPEDEVQRLEDFTVFPERYFCPKDPWTGETEITEDTYAIHHFAGSWNHLADKDMPFIRAVPEMVEAFLRRYREKYQGRPIVIYGTGIVAFNVYKALMRWPEGKKLISFMVTRFDNGWREYRGIPIVELKSVKEWEEEPVVLMGTLTRYHGIIHSSLNEKGYKRIEAIGE